MLDTYNKTKYGLIKGPGSLLIDAGWNVSVVTIAKELGINFEVIQKALGSFTGVYRRSEKKLHVRPC